MALEPEDNETKALAPISKITMVTAIDFYTGKITCDTFFQTRRGVLLIFTSVRGRVSWLSLSSELVAVRKLLLVHIRD